MGQSRLEMHFESESDFEAIYHFVAHTFPKEYIPDKDALREEQIFYMLLRKGMYGGLFGRWLVKQENNNEIIGIGMLIPHLCTPEEKAMLDKVPSTHRGFEVELGYIVANPYRNQGYGLEIGQFLCQQAFEKTNLPRVIGITDTNNPISIRLLQRLNMEVVVLPNSTSVLGWLDATAFKNRA